MEKGQTVLEQELIKQGVNKEDLERLRKFRFIDDDFMSKCFEDNIECTELVVRIVLNRDDLKIQQVHAQHQIKNLQGRSIILDIYAIDEQGKLYNIEIQRADKGADPKRARYHSSVMDSNTLNAKQTYTELPETYVIFITENDVLKKNLPIYHIDRVIRETGEYFEDEAHILYVNGAYQDETSLGILMKDFFCTNPEDMHYQVLYERTRHFKETKEGVSTMCKMMEDMRNEAAKEATRKANEEAERKAAKERIELAKNLIESHKLSLDEIAQYAKLTLEQVVALAKEIGH